VIIVVDIAIIEVQVLNIIEFHNEFHPILNSHLGILSNFNLSICLIILGLFHSELIDWLVPNI
jgi:hypothetical protein